MTETKQWSVACIQQKVTILKNNDTRAELCMAIHITYDGSCNKTVKFNIK